MSIIYERAGEDVIELMKEVIKKYHPVLVHAVVKLDVLMAEDRNAEGELTGKPAVKLHGYPCFATVKVTSYKRRVLGEGDALITIDQEQWDKLTERKAKALLDHELLHLEVVAEGGGTVIFDKKSRTFLGTVKRDDIGRPKLRSRLHDWQLGGFQEIAKRWGEDALEVQAVRVLQDSKTQQYVWDFGTAAQLAQTVADMIPDDGSITVSSGDSSITLDGEDKKRLQQQRDKEFARA